MPRNPLIELQPFAVKQHGHVTVWQALQAGVSRQTLSRLTKQGALVRVHPGVYRLASAPVSLEGRAIAAVLAGGPGALASHSWAARLLGVTRVPATREPEITCPGTWSPQIRGVRVHNSRQLDRCDLTTVGRVPVTSGARTAVDLAHDRLDQAATMALVDDLITLEATTRAWQHRRAHELGNGRAGVDVIARITKPGAEDEFRSWLERCYDVAVVQAFGLPRPSYNVAVHDKRGRIGIADAVWDFGRGVVVELDGLRFHSLSKDRQRDVGRTNRYVLSGRIALRFSYLDVVRTPGKVADQVRQALEAAAR